MADSRRSRTRGPAEDEDDADVKEGDPLEHYAKRSDGSHFSTERFSSARMRLRRSAAFAQWAKAMGFKGYPEVIPNGVDIERFSQKSESPSSPSSRTSQDVVIVTTSRLSLKNGVDDLIRSSRVSAGESCLSLSAMEKTAQSLKRLSVKNLSSRVTFLARKPSMRSRLSCMRPISFVVRRFLKGSAIRFLKP